VLKSDAAHFPRTEPRCSTTVRARRKFGQKCI